MRLALALTLALTSLTHAGGLIATDTAEKDLLAPRLRAIVCHADGKQTTYLSVDFDGKARTIGWLIPCPTKPDVSATAGTRPFFDITSLINQLRTTVSREANLTARFWTDHHVTTTVFDPGETDKLAKWLKHNELVPGDALLAAARQQLQKGYLVAGRARHRGGRCSLKPLRIRYDTPRPTLPIAWGGYRGGMTELRLVVIAEKGDADLSRLASDDETYAIGNKELARIGRITTSASQLRNRDLILRRFELDIPPHLQRHLPMTMPRLRGLPALIDPDGAAATQALLEGLARGHGSERLWFKKQLELLAPFPATERAALARRCKGLTAAAVAIHGALEDRARARRADGAATLFALLGLVIDTTSADGWGELRGYYGGALGAHAVALVKATKTPAARAELLRVATAKQKRAGKHRILAAHAYVEALAGGSIDQTALAVGKLEPTLTAAEREAAPKQLLALWKGKLLRGKHARAAATLLGLLTGAEHGRNWRKWEAELKGKSKPK